MYSQFGLQRGPEVSLLNPSTGRVGMAFDTEVRQFSEEKRRAIMSDAGDPEAWRESLRLQLEEELESRVREVLALQTVSRQAKKPVRKIEQPSEQTEENPVQSETVVANDPVELPAPEIPCIQDQRWKVSEAKRRIREIMSENNKELQNPCYGRQHSTLLLTRLRQTNRNQLTDFLTTLSKASKMPKTRQYYAEITEKAVCHFSELSLSERHSFFYPFTKTGFQEALKIGKLPDGSELNEVGPGLYCDRFGIVRNRHGPFWPVDSGPMLPAPVHKRIVNSKVEPLQTSRTALFRELSREFSNVGQPLKQQEEQRQQLQIQQQLQMQQLRDQQEAELQDRFPGKWRGVAVVFDSEKSPKDYLPPPTLEGQCPSLVFESRFESGNLRQARRVGQFEYELVLSTDINTKRHTQWFYFRVQNAQPKVTYTFKIINLMKKDSLYACGMQPLFYSEHLVKTENKGWIRTGRDVSYTRNLNCLQCPLLSRENSYYVLQWQMEFPCADDTCYLAHCYPYTFSDLRQDLDNLLADAERSKFMKLEVLCQTKAGNSCFLVTVAEDPSETQFGPEKQGIVVTARVHPGETNSSWMMRGLLQHITGPSISAMELRKRFVFKLVPMINPDGVIVGNYRCCLSGHDLNRNYLNPNKDAFPIVWHIKEMISELGSQTQILLYCDLHGHSRKQNVFMYGCAADQDMHADDQPMAYLRGRLFPWLMAKMCPDKFSYPGCKFRIRRCKESTGRVVMYRQLSIKNSFTMEATFCGTTIRPGERKHFNILDFEEMGKKLCDVALKYRNTVENADLELSALHDMLKELIEMCLASSGGSSSDSNVSEVGMEIAEMARNLFELSRDGEMSGVLPGNSSASILSSTLAKLIGSKSLDSFESCLKLSRKMALLQELKESDSSDSDSGSEPECILPKSRSYKRKRRKKTKGQRSTFRGEGGRAGGGSGDADEVKITDLIGNRVVDENRCSATRPDSELPAINSLELDPATRQSKKQLGSFMDSDHTTSKKNFLKSYPMFINKYEGRSNGGIPCFAEERIMIRAAKRTARLQRRTYNEQTAAEWENLVYSDNQHPVASRGLDQQGSWVCVCDRVLPVSLHSSLPTNRHLYEGGMVLPDVGGHTAVDNSYKIENRHGSQSLCTLCGLPQRQSFTAPWNRFQRTNGPYFPQNLRILTSDQERHQDPTYPQLLSTFAPTILTTRLKPDASENWIVMTNARNDDRVEMGRSAANLERTNVLNRPKEVQCLAPSVYQAPLNKY